MLYICNNVYESDTVRRHGIYIAEPMVDPVICVGGREVPTHAPLLKMLPPPGRNIKLYMNNCQRDPVKIFVIKIRNSLFRMLILFDVSGKLQLFIKLVNFAPSLNCLSPL